MSERSENAQVSSNERLLTSDEIKRLMEVYRIRGTLNSSLADLMQECAQRGFDKANTHETPEYRKWPGEPPHCMSCSCGMTDEQKRTVPEADYLRIHRELMDLKYPSGRPSEKANSCVCGEPNSPGTHRTDGPCLAPIGDHYP